MHKEELKTRAGDKETARVLKDSLTETKNNPTAKRTEFIKALRSAQSTCDGMQYATAIAAIIGAAIDSVANETYRSEYTILNYRCQGE